MARTGTSTFPASHIRERRSSPFINENMTRFPLSPSCRMKRGSRASSLSSAIGCVICPTQLVANALPSAYNLFTISTQIFYVALDHWLTIILDGIPQFNVKPLDFSPTDLVTAKHPTSRAIAKNVHMSRSDKSCSRLLDVGRFNQLLPARSGWFPQNHNSMLPCRVLLYKYVHISSHFHCRCNFFDGNIPMSTRAMRHRQDKVKQNYQITRRCVVSKLLV